MKRWLLAIVLAAMPLLAQQDPNEQIQRIVPLKYADPVAIANLLRDFGISVRAEPRMKMLALSGPRNRVTTAEDAIKQLDVPSAAQKDIELTVYFVVGEDVPPNETRPSGNVPPDLQGTVATLKTTFPFKSYYLLDALSLRVRSGMRANTTGQLSGGRYTTFSVESANLEGDGAMIRLERLHAGLRIPRADNSLLDTGITTEVVTVKEGQKLVVGRSSLNGPSTALFLVLIARVAKNDPLSEPPK